MRGALPTGFRSAGGLVAIVYVSASTRRLAVQEMHDLLAQARARNARSDVSGVLLNRDGDYMQYLEGPVAGVFDIYASIQADGRHHGLIELMRERVRTRTFADSALAYGTPFPAGMLPAAGETPLRDRVESAAQAGSSGALLLATFLGSDGWRQRL
jgi:hypothetical protein